MKKITGLFISLLLLGGLSTALHAQDKAIKKGFGLNFSIGVPTGDLAADFDTDEGFEAPITFGLQISNRWYIMPQDEYGFGILVNWLDVALGSKEIETDVRSALYQMSFLEFGPIGTYALDDNMAIDGYYNLKPSFMINIWGDNDYGFGTFGSGFTHAVGAAFRYEVFSVGLEMNFGKINGVFYDTEDGVSDDIDVKDIPTSVFKINLGFKF